MAVKNVDTDLIVDGNVKVTDEAYNATTWNGNFDVPTKNAIRDKIEGLGTGMTSFTIDGDSGTPNTITDGETFLISTNIGLDSAVLTNNIRISLDLSELTDMTATMVGTDEFIVLDSGAERRKAANEIPLSIFDNDLSAVELDDVLSEDGYSGTTAQMEASTVALNRGEVVHIHTDGKLVKAQANAATGVPAIGIVVDATISASAIGTILLYGFMRDNSAFPTITKGGLIFLSDITAGDITHTVPASTGDYIQVLGVGASVNADTIYFNPSMNLIKI